MTDKEYRDNFPAGIPCKVEKSDISDIDEEIYGILSGKGFITIDGEKIELQAGDWLRIAPDGKRQISAASDSPIGFICIQVKAGSLEGYTMTDGVVQ